MSIHIFRGYAATDTPGFLADTTGYLPGNYDEGRAQGEMKRLPTAPCSGCGGTGWEDGRCSRCAGFGLLIVGRPSRHEVTEAVLRAAAERREP